MSAAAAQSNFVKRGVVVERAYSGRIIVHNACTYASIVIGGIVAGTTICFASLPGWRSSPLVEVPVAEASVVDVPVVDAAPLTPRCGEPPGISDLLLKMIGSPSLPVPMTTIFAFGDWASSNVASMPRQRRYDSEMPWLTVF
jgi:hypothetical protein